MSRETMEWLNNMTLIGLTDKRKSQWNEGFAWHYRAEFQGAEPNHYPGPIPIEDVRRRLFNWKVIEGSVESTGTTLLPDGVETFTVVDKERKTMLRPPRALGEDDPGAILGVFKSGYKGHDYEPWLLNNVATLIDDDLVIGSAGLLKQGAVAWVTIEVPETITTPEGVEFRPHLLGTTSFDGSIATTYKRAFGLPVCDNTLEMVLGELGQTYKVRHSRYSDMKLTEAREALAIVHTMADAFSAEVARLTAIKMTPVQWGKSLDILAPLTDEKGEPKTGRGLTSAESKRATLNRLWNNDNRVAPWNGTAFGFIQAINTYSHHEQTVKGATRPERNMMRAVSGDFGKLTESSFDVLSAVGVM